MGRYLSQFEEMLRICARTGMKVIPSLVDFPIGEPAAAITREERWTIVTNRNVRDQFFAQAFRPLLQISARPEYSGSIYAWEVMNEPHWLRSTGATPDPDPKLSDQALDGIRDYWRLAP
jgi:hypothetical protein